MNTNDIKDRLITYNRQFKRVAGTFKSYEVVFYYVKFLKTEPYLKNLLDEAFVYAEEQLSILIEDSCDPEKRRALEDLNIDLNSVSSIKRVPYFKKEFRVIAIAMKAKGEPPIMSFLPIYLSDLIQVCAKIEAIRDCQKNGDKEGIREITENIKNESFSLIKNIFIKNANPTPQLLHTYLDSCMELVNKYIFDQIDVEDFLSEQGDIKEITFDSGESMLKIRGEKVRISRQKRKSTDHYILECIFSKDNISEMVDFSEISNEFIGEEYNKVRDWSKFRHACDNLNRKLENGTTQRLKEFIIYSSEKLGWCKINQRYL